MFYFKYTLLYISKTLNDNWEDNESFLLLVECPKIWFWLHLEKKKKAL